MGSTIGDIGEFGLIARVTAKFPQTENVIIGPGDDAAVVRAADGRVVATTDLLVEGRHFRRDWSSARDVGHKAAAQNLADVAAMGARPTALLVGLAAPPDLPTAWTDELSEGLSAECALAGAAVVGGDVVRADTVTLAITALGDLGGRAAVRRDGARPGDLVAVNGTLGRSAAGLALLRAGADGPAECLAAHRRPRPPYPEGPRAADLGATAMLDVSDGLVQDLGHVAAASGVAIALREEALPADPVLEEAVRVLAGLGAAPPRAAAFMLAGGEDHAMAAAFPAGTRLPAGWTEIGAVTEGDGVTVDGAVPPRGGWDHFG
ncbi:thiamine-phosphate kinase [Marinitenerispora sediminis]|uniref:Thiamine-monophosphate kinase n=1 Tax=Marinitenerispora sediminis TaxID=1931232 RepID=A0A368TBF1_9ACTN|nr:thiamine-phosphate kinase [Marinitenerispora sediminis]RCV54038.1 thiamine-phosphate kinase [Marinitenerispora sediminis]RCV60812.1 thiamine-phosphate kinase [Marinitenerispora sediminis]RCV62442.1 thiamine-phosphate kinase [Marinitenerispora sediminis]